MLTSDTRSHWGSVTRKRQDIPTGVCAFSRHKLELVPLQCESQGNSAGDEGVTGEQIKSCCHSGSEPTIQQKQSGN